MPTLMHHMDTLKKNGNFECGRGGFLRPQRSEGRVEQSGTGALVSEPSCLKAASVPGTAAAGSP